MIKAFNICDSALLQLFVVCLCLTPAISSTNEPGSPPASTTNRPFMANPSRSQPLHGGYTNWSPWSACSKSCGVGTRLRSRTCSNPVPRLGGHSCSGPSTEKKECKERPCPGADAIEQTVQVRKYSAWSECTATCGGGTKQRQCDGKNCDFLLTDGGMETQRCNTHPCAEFFEEPLKIGFIFGSIALITILLIASLLVWRKWRSRKKYDNQPTDVEHIGDPFSGNICSSPTLPCNQITIDEVRQSRTDMIDNPLRAELDWERQQFDKSPRYTAAPYISGKIPYNGLQTTGNELATPEDFVFYRRPHENMQDLEKEAGKVFDVKMIRSGYDEKSLPRVSQKNPVDQRCDTIKTDDDVEVPKLSRNTQAENEDMDDIGYPTTMNENESINAPPIPARKCGNDNGKLQNPLEHNEDEEKPPLMPRKATMAQENKPSDINHNSSTVGPTSSFSPSRPTGGPTSPCSPSRPTGGPTSSFSPSRPTGGPLDLFDSIIRELETVQEVDTDSEQEGQKGFTVSTVSADLPQEGPICGKAVPFQRQGSEVYFELPPSINKETKKKNLKVKTFNREDSVEV